MLKLNSQNTHWFNDFKKRIEQTSPDKAEEEVSFCCPLCGSIDYSEHTESNGILGPGGHTWVTHYKCKGCSIHFGDPEKMSVIKKKSKESWNISPPH